MSLSEISLALSYVFFAFLPGFLIHKKLNIPLMISVGTGLAVSLLLFTFIAKLIPSPLLAWIVTLIALGLVSHSNKLAQKCKATNPLSTAQNLSFLFFFLLLFFGLLLLRTQFSQIQFEPGRSGAEKLFNLQFLQSFVHGSGYPPESLWFSDTPIGYYLLPKVLPGVFLAGLNALPTSAFGNPAGLVFHISDCFFVALSSLIVAQFVFDIRPRVKKESNWTFAAAILCGLFPLFSGPLRALEQAYGRNSQIDLWSLSRIIPNTVNEYPFWNFVWADNHSHSNVLPLQFCFLYWFFRMLQAIKDKTDVAFNLFLVAVCAVCVAMSHSGSVFIALCACGVIGSLAFVESLRNKNGTSYINHMSLLASAAFLLFLPDYLTRPMPNVKWYFVPSNLRSTFAELAQINFSHILLMLLVFAAILSGGIQKPLSHLKNLRVLSLVLTALMLVIVPEFVASNWDMGDQYMRYNTLFRFLFESYYWFPVLLGVLVSELATSSKNPRTPFVTLTLGLVCVLGLFLLPHYKTWQVRAQSQDQRLKGLDGLKWFQQEHPSDWAIAEFLRNLPQKHIVIAEECGMPPKSSAYSSLGRIAALSGRPALCGWGQHVFLFQKPSINQQSLQPANERLKNTWEQLLDREKWLREVYSSQPASTTTQEALHKLKLTHLVFGELEKKQSPQLSLANLSHLGRIVFEREGYGVIELFPQKIQ